MTQSPSGAQRSSSAASLLDTVLEASVVGSFTRMGPAIRRRAEHWAAPAATPGRVVVITGASSGLGREAALELGALGCSVIAVGRDQARLDEVVTAIRAAGESARSEQADLGDLAATAALANRIRAGGQTIDVLIHNAGALLADRRLGAQGHELTVTVQLLSPYLLTELLRPVLAPQAKVITMTSGGMYTERFDIDRLEMGPEDYRGSVAYARAKRAQVVLTAALQEREPEGGLDFHAVHPGWAKTPGISDSLPGFSRLMGPLLRSPAEGVDTLVWLATSPAGTPGGGQLWLDRRARSSHRLRRTRVDAATEQTNERELLVWLAETSAGFRDEEE